MNDQIQKPDATAPSGATTPKTMTAGQRLKRILACLMTGVCLAILLMVVSGVVIVYVLKIQESIVVEGLRKACSIALGFWASYRINYGPEDPKKK